MPVETAFELCRLGRKGPGWEGLTWGLPSSPLIPEAAVRGTCPGLGESACGDIRVSQTAHLPAGTTVQWRLPAVETALKKTQETKGRKSATASLSQS